jgi:hypothetical protein
MLLSIMPNVGYGNLKHTSAFFWGLATSYSPKSEEMVVDARKAA